MNKLSQENKVEMRTNLLALNRNAREFIDVAQKARDAGEISEGTLGVIKTLVRQLTGPLASLSIGLICDYTDVEGVQKDVARPVHDDELPDWNLVTTDVPDN